MTRSLKPTLRRWRRELEPVVVQIPSALGAEPPAADKLSEVATAMARRLGRSVIIASGRGFVVAGPNPED